VFSLFKLVAKGLVRPLFDSNLASHTVVAANPTWLLAMLGVCSGVHMWRPQYGFEGAYGLANECFMHVVSSILLNGFVFASFFIFVCISLMSA
jgi:hypothetical protein